MVGLNCIEIKEETLLSPESLYSDTLTILIEGEMLYKEKIKNKICSFYQLDFYSFLLFRYNVCWYIWQ